MNHPQNNQQNEITQPSSVLKGLQVPLADQLTWSRKEAAGVCGISVYTFSKWVNDGLMPPPFANGRFSNHSVRESLKNNSELMAPENLFPLQEWEANNG